jgi:NADH-quinone oxidoreductase subunit G
MPEILVDGRKVTVPAGTNLVDASLAAGVPIPIFCYHKDLGAVGSCRVCACTVTSQGKSRLVMACMTEAADGMEVSTLDPASVQLRKYVLEWLMVNHPHDCPICDEGGECQLQDLTIASGHGVRRYEGPKRTFENQYLGEFIQHEMNRCITCYRCSRFYQEYAGGRDFGPTGSRDRVYFGRFEDGPLESPFSGNLVELCPTGVFTDKLFRYRSRVWDLEIAHSVCPHCSVGCNVHPGSRHRELQRVRVCENPAVNGVFLCDRGQFGHGYVMDPARPRQVRARGEVAEWTDALGVVGGALLGIARDHGPSSIAFVTSARASVETHAALEALASGPLEGVRVVHFDDPDREARARAALRALATAEAQPLEQSDIPHCDALIVAGVSLVDEAPLAALAVRQAARRGARVFVLNAGERYLHDVAEKLMPIHPARLADDLGAIGAAIGGNTGAATSNGSDEAAARAIASALVAAERPGILVGCDLVDGPTIAAGALIARVLATAGKQPRLGYVFPGPNGFGAAAMARGASLAETLDELTAGRLRAVVMVESDASEWSCEARDALAGLDLLVTLDYVDTPVSAAAHVFLPTSATYESSGCYVNRAGRVQAFAPARRPGVSVPEMIQNGSFPRTPRLEPPASDARAAWVAIETLRELTIGKPEARDLENLRAALGRERPEWQPMRNAVPGHGGVVLDPTTLVADRGGDGVAPRGQRTRMASFAFPRPEQGLAIYRAERTLGSEMLSRRSPAMRKMAGAPVALLSKADAERLGVRGRAALEVSGRVVEVETRALASVPAGIVLVPRDVEWPFKIEPGATVRVAAAALEEVTR